MPCKELAQSFFFLANKGETKAGIPILTKSQVKRRNALMQTCGFYDESGEFTIQCNCLMKAELQEELLVCILRIL